MTQVSGFAQVGIIANPQAKMLPGRTQGLTRWADDCLGMTASASAPVGVTPRRSFGGTPLPPIAELLRRDVLVSYFQPVLSARQRMVMGVEALARVVMPDG